MVLKHAESKGSTDNSEGRQGMAQPLDFKTSMELLAVPGVFQIHCLDNELVKITIDKNCGDVAGTKRSVTEIMERHGVQFYVAEVLDKGDALRNAAHRRVLRTEQST